MAARAARVGTAVVIVLFNRLRRTLVVRLASRERHHSREEMVRSVTRTLTPALFFNSVVVILLATSRLPPPMQQRVPGILHALRVLDGHHSDAGRAWYHDVGSVVTLVFVLDALAACATRLCALALSQALA